MACTCQLLFHRAHRGEQLPYLCSTESIAVETSVGDRVDSSISQPTTTLCSFPSCIRGFDSLCPLQQLPATQSAQVESCEHGRRPGAGRRWVSVDHEAHGPAG